MVEFLLKKGADIRASDANKTTLLYFLISEGLSDFFSLERDDIISSDTSGYTLLHLAALCGNLGLVEHFIEKKCDINARSNSGSTVLHLAVGSNHQNIVSFLLRKGVEIDAVDDNGLTPLLLAVEINCKETVEILVSFETNDIIRDGRIEALQNSALLGYSNIVDLLLENCKFDVTNELMRKLLVTAVNCNHKQVVAILLKNGFEVNGDAKPLHVATRHSYHGMVEFLLTKGANPNLLDENNCTPLDIAINLLDTDMCEILLSEKANIHIEKKFILSAT
ncbi:unnamed protein product [Larinioides sclopetarius]|uniref:Ankyrin repeat protein n=1 Tax=Larinioides sclopetarius TaxID=280406 RepID=A0AAV2BW32_9ARAC